MHTVEIDFDVFKALTALRTTESVSHNDVIRGLLKLPARPLNGSAAIDAGDQDWVCKGVRFPAATEFRAQYKGQVYGGKVERGALVVDGKAHNNPSNAAMAITHNSVNGWDFWECRLPGEANWRRMSSLRT